MGSFDGAYRATRKGVHDTPQHLRNLTTALGLTITIDEVKAALRSRLSLLVDDADPLERAR